MQAYTELIPPTAVTHSVSLPFISAKASNLVVAKGSLLQIFSLKTVASESTSTDREGYAARIGSLAGRRAHNDETVDGSYLDGSIVPQRLERTVVSKLGLEAEYPISGIILSLARIKISTIKNGTEALLVGVRDAKISLLAWDSNRHAVSTVSIHYYEAESIQRCPWAPDLSLSSSKLTVDPGSRCVALKFGTRSLAILPFHQIGFEDMAMDDFEDELDAEVGEQQQRNESAVHDVVGQDTQQTPYRSSFLLSLSLIDPNLVYPVDLSFLYEYREPTFGVLSSATNASASLTYERRDVMTYNVFSLDLEQRASTTLLSVSKLPSDLSRVIPLPTPVGGSLLIGANELVHIDQAGKTSAVAVNEFARRSSQLGMADQSNLQLRLEFCEVEQLGVQSGDVLLILETGELAILTFKLDGRTVSGLSIRKVDEKHGGKLLRGGASCCTSLGRGRVFIGGEETDATLLGWTRRSAHQGRRNLEADLNGDANDTALDFDDVRDYDDDLYENGTQDVNNDGDLGAPPSHDGDYVFRIHHNLVNLSPTLDLTVAPQTMEKAESYHSKARQLVVSSKSGKSSSIHMLRKSLIPDVTINENSPGLKGVWTVRAKRPAARGMPQVSAGDASGYSADSLYDRYLFLSKISDGMKESSTISRITPNGFKALDLTKFEGDTGPTIDVGILSNGTRIVQIVPHQLQSFDGDLDLVGIVPMIDELTGEEPAVVSASFADPYVLVIRDDDSIFVMKCDDHGEIDEVERGDPLVAKQWISGSLYCDFRRAFDPPGANSSGKKESPILMFLLTANGGLHIYRLPDLTKPAFVAEGLGFLHPMMQPDETYRRSAIREHLLELSVADLGDSVSTKPYLIIRNSRDCLVLYEPFHCSAESGPASMKNTLRFNKIVHSSYVPSSIEIDVDMEHEDAVKRNNCMQRLVNIGGYALVHIPGKPGRFLMKSTTSTPMCLDVPSIKGSCLSSFHSLRNEHSWISLDNAEDLTVCSFPPGFEFNELGWSSQTVMIGQEIQALECYEREQAYVLATNRKEEYELPKDDDSHKNWAVESLSLKPLIDRSSLKILHPKSWTLVDSFDFGPTEIVLAVKVMDLEVSEVSRQRDLVIVVGTSIAQGIDLPTKGCIYAFKIIPVVPWPGQPETGLKFKLLGKESVKGAVSSICSIGREGFFLAANGQKCMVRGLKEDGTMLPVAFLDAQTYVTVTKSLPNAGVCLIADAARGLWLAGYRDSPYRISIFGKSGSDLEIVAAEFIPEGDSLYIVAADAALDLYIFQYDPENPKSLSGQKLLQRSTFHLGQFVSSMHMLPSSLPFPQPSRAPSESPLNPPQQVLITTRSGAIGVLQPLPATTYSVLSAVATHLNTMLDHIGGLNSRGYRQAVADGVGGRVLLDGSLLRRFWELGCGKRADLLGRVGAEGVEVREALKWLGASGLEL
ncbi:MAG: mRNA cleavage and polyadenylation factor subunit [Vezdaea aestivalis]|nr:MAG: mRNA cleavage and polyadenylation factor subunit [Vezdaea aestivalis]